MEEDNKRKGPSLNYAFSHMVLPQFFFRYPKPFVEYLTGRKEDLNDEFAFILKMLVDRGYEVVDFTKGIYYKSNIDRDVGALGLLIQLPEPQSETECNFICLAFTKEDCYYFTSELFEESFFSKRHFELCGWKGQQHSVYHTELEDITSIEDMWKAVTYIIGKKETKNNDKEIN